ncbi:MAG TPA: hypothetical protein VF440_05115, partial [Novosphingobium sp.]
CNCKWLAGTADFAAELSIPYNSFGATGPRAALRPEGLEPRHEFLTFMAVPRAIGGPPFFWQCLTVLDRIVPI